MKPPDPAPHPLVGTLVALGQLALLVLRPPVLDLRVSGRPMGRVRMTRREMARAAGRAIWNCVRSIRIAWR